MDKLYTEWSKALTQMQAAISKDLAEVHKAKIEVQKAKEELQAIVSAGHYLRNEDCVVISAPHIIIGNVDRDGVMRPGCGSSVTLRACNINLEGVSAGDDYGMIKSRATSIVQQAVNPGPDGIESVVEGGSLISSQAKRIVIQSNNAEDVFTQPPVATPETGIRIHADQNLTLEAAVSNDFQSKNNSDAQSELTKQQMSLQGKMATLGTSLTASITKLTALLTTNKALATTNETVSVSYQEIMDVQDEFYAEQKAFYNTAQEFYSNATILAEISRQQKAYKAEQQKLSSEKDQYKKTISGSHISMNTEFFAMTATDGDGNFYTTPDAGLFYKGKTFRVATADETGALIPESKLELNSLDMNITTGNPKLDEKCEKGDIPADGELKITSKKISIEGVDYELKDGKNTEKALTAGATIEVRAETINVSATDTEGKATGKAAINAKAVEIKGVDVDKESRADKDMAAGTTVTMVSEKVIVGKTDDKNMPAEISLDAKNVKATGKEGTTIKQGENATIELKGDNAKINAKANEITGDLTVKSKTEFSDAVEHKADLKGTNLKMNKVEASASLKSPNIKDGM